MRERLYDEQEHTRDFPCITVIKETRPKANFDHTCSACGLIIPCGTHYTKVVYRDDDALDRKHNLRCSRLHLCCPPPENF